MNTNKSHLIECFIEDEFFNNSSFDRTLNWSYYCLEHGANAKDHNIARLASLQSTDAENVQDFVEKIIGRFISIEDREEWAGKHLLELSLQLKSNQINQWDLIDQLYKLAIYLGEPKWLEDSVREYGWADEDSRENWLPRLDEFYRVVDLWKRFPTYTQFHANFK